MLQCKLCLGLVESMEPYCRQCGHARISDSLLERRQRQLWSDRILAGFLATVLLGFVVTLAVAFLREAQALRWSRTALLEGRNQDAYRWVQPFAQANPASSEGRYLAGLAAFRTDNLGAAMGHYQYFDEVDDSPDDARRKGEIEEAYDDYLLRAAGRLDCGRSQFAELYRNHRQRFGESQPTLLDAVRRIAGQCAGETPGVANEPVYWLIHELGYESVPLVRSIYGEIVSRAIESGNFGRARQATLVGLSVDTQAQSALDSVLASTRGRYQEEISAATRVCEAVAADSRFAKGRNRCYPPDEPEAVRTYLESRDLPLVYLPSSPHYRDAECFRSFEIRSVALEESSSSGPTALPAGFAVHSARGACRLGEHDPFWLRGS